jgi:prepilin-type processing-associated H-X9-DG protein
MARHLETANVLWADGHVKALRVDKFYIAQPGQASPCLNPETGVYFQLRDAVKQGIMFGEAVIRV